MHFRVSYNIYKYTIWKGTKSLIFYKGMDNNDMNAFAWMKLLP